MDEKVVQSLKKFLEGGRDWERKPTSIPGVFIMKLPGYGKSSSKLAAEINPVDAYGNPTKKRGLLIRTGAELENYKKILASEKIAGLLEALERVNPQVQRRGESTKEIIEI